MSAKTVLAEAVARGLTLMTNGEKIIYTGPREAVTDDLLDRLRQHKAELLRLLPAEAEKTGQVLHTNYGRGYQHADGRVETGTSEPMPPPAADWPADLNDMLRRVSCAFEWSTADRRDFIAWARRDQQGIDDARVFLQAECDQLDIRLARG